MSDEREPTEEELTAFFISAVREMRCVDNGDGTSTMTFYADMNGTQMEFSTLFEVSIGELMGEAIKSAVGLVEAFESKGIEAIAIPNTPEEAE